MGCASVFPEQALFVYRTTLLSWCGVPLDVLDAPNLSIDQPYLDPMGVRSGVGQNILDDPTGQLSCSLVLLENDGDFDPRMYISTDTSIWHAMSLSTNPGKWMVSFPRTDCTSVLPFSIAREVLQHAPEQDIRIIP